MARLAHSFAPRNGRPRKYRNEPTVVDGIRFDSKREAARWGELRMLERGGAISDLKRQVTFPLEVNGVKLGSYRADFTYREHGELVVEDSKGFRTPEYRQKARLMRACHGVTIRET